MKTPKLGYFWSWVIIAVLLLAALVGKKISSNKSSQLRAAIPKVETEQHQVVVIPETQEIKVSEFVKRYAGEYEIMVDDFNSPGTRELMTLDPYGYCTWKWVEQRNIMSTKHGTWTAIKGKINTVVEGRTGPLPEDFTYRNGAFRNGHRYLRKIKNL